MSETIAEKLKLTFGASVVTSGPAPVLEVNVKNDDATQTGYLLIELKLIPRLAAQAVRDAAENARTKEEPDKNLRGREPLGGIVTAPAGWSVWAVSTTNDTVVTIQFLNDTDQQTGRPVTPTKLDASATLTLRIPLAPKADAEAFTLNYGYNHTLKRATRFDGPPLQLTPAGLGDWKPQVSFIARSHTSPTMIPAGEDVIIEWAIEDAVSATIRGPLSGGNNEQALSLDESSSWWIKKGSMKIKAVGAATYVLDALVKGPKVKGSEDRPNMQVVRTLHIDIFSSDKFSNLEVRPAPVLPNDPVEIDWAVWGVQKATLYLGSRDSLTLELTQKNLSGAYQGTGVWRVYSSDEIASEPVTFKVDVNPTHKANQKDSINTTLWEKCDPRPVFEGKPRGLDVAQGVMALLTSDGLWTATVGTTGPTKPRFSKAQAGGKGWHALTAARKEFVALRQTDDDYFVLERYNKEGQRIKSPVTLPEDFQTLARRPLTGFELVWFNERVYVVAAGHAPGRWARVAYSVRFEPDEKVSEEPLLSRLNGYLLVSFDGALYAYRRRTGQMLRFDAKKGGGLEPPRRAASGVTNEGRSMFRAGLPVPAGSVLVVLDPSAPPSPELEPPMGVFGNALAAQIKTMSPRKKADEIPRDFVYNPQKDSWATCGHGLQLEPGAVAAFRGGAAPRLWVIQEGETYTLTGADEELFARDFSISPISKDLPLALDATRELTLANDSGFDLVPVDDVCRAVGVNGLGADGVADLSAPLEPLPHSARRQIKFSYSSTDTKEVKLRLMVAKPVGPRYLLEVSLSGERLGAVTTVFKRLAADDRLDDIPETLKQHDATQITVGRPDHLHARVMFLLVNGTPKELSVSPAVELDKVMESVGLKLSHATPDVKISIPGAEHLGPLWVTLDYAMPKGVELSPRSETQRKLIRVAADDPRLLDLTAGHHASGLFEYEKYDGSKSTVHLKEDIYWCRVGAKKKFELDFVRFGDAVSHPNTRALYLPLAKKEETARPRLYKFENGEIVASTDFRMATKGGVLARPNAVAVNEMHVHAVFAEPVLNYCSHDLSIPWSRILANAIREEYAEIIALGAGARDAYMLGRRANGYYFVAAQYPNEVWEMRLDQAAIQPSVGVSLAVSPDGKLAVLGQYSGFLFIEVASRKVVHVNVPNGAHPTHAVFSHDGQWFYCAHATRDAAMNPRRITKVSRPIITRARVGNPTEIQTLALPDVEGNAGLSADTRQNLREPRDEIALSLAPSPDGQSLFVSAGTKILKIALRDFKPLPWSTTVELPCRLACVKEGWGNTWTVYALGSYYKGDGAKVDEFKTHLYAVPAPRN